MVGPAMGMFSRQRKGGYERAKNTIIMWDYKSIFDLGTLYHIVSYACTNQIRFNGIHIGDLSLLIKAPRQDII